MRHASGKLDRHRLGHGHHVSSRPAAAVSTQYLDFAGARGVARLPEILPAMPDSSRHAVCPAPLPNAARAGRP